MKRALSKEMQISSLLSRLYVMVIGPSGTTTIVLLRHGVTSASRKKLADGTKPNTDVDMTEEGKQQVRAAVSYIVEEFPHVDKVYSDGVRRTYKTAKAAQESYNHVPDHVVDDRLANKVGVPVDSEKAKDLVFTHKLLGWLGDVVQKRYRVILVCTHGSVIKMLWGLAERGNVDREKTKGKVENHGVVYIMFVTPFGRHFSTPLERAEYDPNVRELVRTVREQSVIICLMGAMITLMACLLLLLIVMK